MSTDGELNWKLALELIRSPNEQSGVRTTKILLSALEKRLIARGQSLQLSEEEKREDRWRRIIQCNPDDMATEVAKLQAKISLIRAGKLFFTTDAAKRDAIMQTAERDCYLANVYLLAAVQGGPGPSRLHAAQSAQIPHGKSNVLNPSFRGRSGTGSHKHSQQSKRFNGQQVRPEYPPYLEPEQRSRPPSTSSSHYERQTIAPTIASSRASRADRVPSIHVVPPGTPRAQHQNSAGGYFGLGRENEAHHSPSVSSNRGSLRPAASQSAGGKSRRTKAGFKDAAPPRSSRHSAVGGSINHNGSTSPGHTNIPNPTQQVPAASLGSSLGSRHGSKAAHQAHFNNVPYAESAAHGKGAAAEYYAQSAADEAGASHDATMPRSSGSGAHSPHSNAKSQRHNKPTTSYQSQATEEHRGHTPYEPSIAHDTRKPSNLSETNSRHDSRAPSLHDFAAATGRGSSAPSMHSRAPSNQTALDFRQDSKAGPSVDESPDHVSTARSQRSRSIHHKTTGSKATSRVSSKATGATHSHQYDRSHHGEASSQRAPSHAPSQKSKAPSFLSKVFGMSGGSRMQSEAASQHSHRSRRPEHRSATPAHTDTTFSKIDMLGYERRPHRAKKCHHPPSLAPTYCDSEAGSNSE